MMNSYRIIMLVKAPKEGMVKSRLAASVGEDIALHLYKCFVDDLLRMFTGCRYPLAIFFYPPESRQKIIQWLGNEHTLFPQTGDNLGERMKMPFRQVSLRVSVQPFSQEVTVLTSRVRSSTRR